MRRCGFPSWTAHEDAQLAQFAQEGSDKYQCAHKMNRSYGAIDHRARILRIKFTPARSGLRVNRLTGASWTEDRISLAKSLWDDGRSANEIAIRLGGVTRNAVLGKLHRLGLAGRSPVRLKAVKRVRKRYVPKPRSTIDQMARRPSPLLRLLTMNSSPLPPPLETDIPRVSFLELDDKPVVITGNDGVTRIVKKHCRWSCVEDPKKVATTEPQYCGDQQEPGLPYCRSHALRAFNATELSTRVTQPRLPPDLAEPIVIGRQGQFASA